MGGRHKQQVDGERHGWEKLKQEILEGKIRHSQNRLV